VKGWVRPSNAGKCCSGDGARTTRQHGRRRSDAGRSFTGWGIRTSGRGGDGGALQSDVLSRRIDGPHATSLIALGFARLWLKIHVAHLFKALFDAATYMDLRGGFPELFWGFGGKKNVADERSIRSRCAPQAVGEPHAVTMRRRHSGSNSTNSAAKLRCVTRACRLSSRSGAAGSQAWRFKRRISGSPPRRRGGRLESLATRGPDSRCPSCGRQ